MKIRLSKLTPETKEKILNGIMNGLPYATAAQIAGISERTFHRWIKQGKEAHSERGIYWQFWQDIKRANEIAKAKWIQDIIKDESWQSRAWLLERRFPDEFGRQKIDIDHSGEIKGGGANGGKSWLGCEWLLSMCREYPETRWFIGREELKRLRESTLITFYKVCRFHGIEPTRNFKYNAVDHNINFFNGSQISLLDLRYLPSDPLYERYGSIEYTGGWIEEAGEVHFGAFDVLKSRINRHNNEKYDILGKILITCNPKKNWLYHEFYHPWKRNELPENLAFIQALWGDNWYREKGSEDKLKQIKDRATLERLYYGNWDYADEPDQLITYEMIEACRSVRPVLGLKKLGVDVARFGDDETVLCYIDGNTVMKFENFHGLSIDRTSVIVQNTLVKNYIGADSCGIDGVGLGAGVVDNLKKAGFNVIEIIGGAKPVPDDSEYKFSNLRSQMWYHAREMIEQKQVSLKDANPKLFDDLTTPKYEIRGDKTVIVESKDEIKKRLGRSPDYGDAFVYALFVEKMSQSIEIDDVEVF